MEHSKGSTVQEKSHSGSENEFGNKMYHCLSMSWVFHHFQEGVWGCRLLRSLMDIPNRLVSCVDQGMVGLDAIAG